MNIVLGDQAAQAAAQKYTVLSLDTFRLQSIGQVVKSFCVIENLPVHELSTLVSMKDLHEKLMDNYAKQNWNFCLQALEHLKGRWNGEIDSFYLDLESRINHLRSTGSDESWSPIIDRPAQDI